MSASTSTFFVVMYGGTPLAAAADLDAAQRDALTRQTAWSGADKWDYRWDEYLPGKVWRLMQRRKGSEGKGRRFSWTTYSVHTVEHVTEAAPMSTPIPKPGTAHYRLLALLDRYADPQGKLDAFLAEKLRTIVDTLELANPDRNADFSEGVDWTLDHLRSLINDLSGGAR